MEPKWITTLSALLTPTIAIIAVLVAIRQSKINQNKLRLELFDRRIEIFQKIGAYLSEILQTGYATNSELTQFLRDTQYAYFVFGKDIQEYVEEIYKKSNDLYTVVVMFDKLKDSKAQEKNEDKRKELFTYFEKEIVSFRKRFEKYLKLQG